MNTPQITGLYGCICHPFASWEECKAMHNQKLAIGQKVKNRHTCLEGEVFEIHPEKGFVTVKYGELQSNQHLEHVATLIVNSK
jgi:heat shock protein HspQ